MSYATERDAAVRTPQAILTLGVAQCQNWYAKAMPQGLFRTEDFTEAHWTKFGTPATVNSNTHAAPDGSLTADTLNFPAVNDAVYQDSGLAVTSKTWTGSVWLRSTTGAGTIEIRVLNAADTQNAILVGNLTTTWQRFSIQKQFSGVAVDGAVFMIARRAGDLSAVVAWGANLTQNPTNDNLLQLFPYRKRTDENNLVNSVKGTRCTAADAGDGNRCYYSAPTCQDPANFNAGNDYEATPALRGIREYKFCQKNAPLPFTGGTLIRPMLSSWDQAPQEIDGTRAVLDKESKGGFVTRNEEVTYRLEDDADPGVWDLEKQSAGALTNTGKGSGTFWRRWRAIHLNLDNPRGYAKLSTGYIFAGSTEADYQLRLSGPMKRIKVSNGGIASIEASDGLHVTKRKIPSKISSANLLSQSMSAVTTSLSVNDPGEISDPAPNADAVETFDAAGVRTGGPDWIVSVLVGTEKMNVISKTDGGNPLTVQRGRWGTAAATHATNNAFSEIREFGTEQTTPGNPVLGANPMDIKHSLYRQAGIAWAQIDTAFNNDERDTWISSSIDKTNGTEGGALFRRTLTEPTEIDALLQEIDRDIVSFQFVTDARTIRTKIFAPVRPSETLVELTDISHFVENSVEVETDLEARLSRVVVGWDLIAGKGGDVLGDYAKAALSLNPTQEGPGFHGTIRDRIILSQWIRPSDSGRGASTAAKILARFINGARLVVGELEAKDDDNVTLGSFVFVTTAQIQKPDGSTDSKKIMLVVRKERHPDSGRMTIRFLDTAISGRFAFWQDAAGAPADYDSATDAQRRYAFWANALGKVGATNADPYLWN